MVVDLLVSRLIVVWVKGARIQRSGSFKGGLDVSKHTFHGKKDGQNHDTALNKKLSRTTIDEGEDLKVKRK